ncbi:MAG: MoxR family ATPase [Chitinophagales bacterium]
MEEQTITPETPAINPSWNQNHLALEKIGDSVNRIRTEIGKVIVGQDDMVTLLITGLFAGGHLLIEGVPGIAKTLTAKLLAKTLSIQFSRIQFTPDLMPSDVIGTSVFNFKNSEFTFNRGPVFSNIVLIDEINRSPAKTQAALFEVMEEQQITVDGTTYKMEFPFIVIATQNPIEQEGTYKLPEAQLDRFLYRVKINYPSLEEEKKIIHRFKEDFSNRKTEEVIAVFSAVDIAECRTLVEQIHIKDELVEYIASIVHQTRNHGDLFLGASPRASLAILRSSKALAAIRGRDFVTPDDIQFVSYPVLNHRIILTPEREMEGMEVEDVIKEIIQKIEVPR